MTKPSPPQNEDTFHKARSRLIDSYARLELRLAQSLLRAGLPVKGDTVATKIKTIRENANPASLSKLGNSLERLNELASIRADFVHGVMILTDENGERFASFRNPREITKAAQRPTQIVYKSLVAFSKELDSLSEQLLSLEFNPASSPPPPSPDATADP